MPSWQSALFSRMSRMSRPNAAAGVNDVEELRRQFTYLTSRYAAVPNDAVFEAGQMGPVKGEWVRVNGAAPHRVILYFHGGGYISGSPETHRALIARLCSAAGANAFSVGYRLAPDFAFPAGLRDGIDAYRHLLQHGIAASQIVLAGDEHEPIPVNVIAPHGRLQVPKVRAFVDFAVPRLKAHFTRLSHEAESATIQSLGGRVSAE